MRRALPDYLAPGLDIVFVGINPGLYSAARRHYYARPANLFWRALHESGLTPERLGPEDDERLSTFGLGLTDVVARASRGSGDLSAEELARGGRALLARVRRYAPRIICFNGLTGYRACFGRAATPGLQPDRVGGTRVYVVPSTSRRNAAYSPEAVIGHFRALKRYLDDLKGS
ncbi:MAG: mismatch-specific DNA-glycosylase [Dehalococcoidia bacterium]|nr:mismatch-specific DNA-glycosylase [Dehalococcoidia bacterium]